jgi:hypothetical protein
MRESTRQRLAFDLYVALGPGRSLEKLHEAIAADSRHCGLGRVPGLRTLYRWSSELYWQDCLADLEREARRRDNEDLLEQLVAMNQRQVEIGQKLQRKGEDRLESLPSSEMSPAEAIRAITEGIRVERMARGEATERTVVERSEKIDLTTFSLAELRDLARLATGNSGSDRSKKSG